MILESSQASPRANGIEHSGSRPTQRFSRTEVAVGMNLRGAVTSIGAPRSLKWEHSSLANRHFFPKLSISIPKPILLVTESSKEDINSSSHQSPSVHHVSASSNPPHPLKSHHLSSHSIISATSATPAPAPNIGRAVAAAPSSTAVVCPSPSLGTLAAGPAWADVVSV